MYMCDLSMIYLSCSSFYVLGCININRWTFYLSIYLSIYPVNPSIGPSIPLIYGAGWLNTNLEKAPTYSVAQYTLNVTRARWESSLTHCRRHTLLDTSDLQLTTRMSNTQLIVEGWGAHTPPFHRLNATDRAGKIDAAWIQCTSTNKQALKSLTSCQERRAPSCSRRSRPPDPYTAT